MSKNQVWFGYVFIIAVVIAFVMAFLNAITGKALQNLDTLSVKVQAENHGIVTLTSCDSHDKFEYHNRDYVSCGQDSGKKSPNKNTTVDPVVSVTVNPTVETVSPTVDNPTVESPAENPTEKSCKNKNSGKDGTPAECNAGIGQEKNQ
jgi:hypothetical protein